MEKTGEKKYPKLATNVFVFNDKNQLLMGRRIGKTGYGTWCLPGGHFEWGESLEGCAKRELEEETSIIGDDLEYLHLINDPRLDESNGGTHYVHINFLVKKWHGEARVTEPDKFESWKWYELDNLPKEIFIGHQKIIPAFLNKLNFVDK